MIAYFDTSALIPLLVGEAGSDRAARLWDSADRVISARLVYPEARAALAHAARLGRLSPQALRSTVRVLGDLVDELAVVELDAGLAHRAGELAEAHSLRGYDAVHLAAAEVVADEDLVVVAGDGSLLRAAEALGIAIASTA